MRKIPSPTKLLIFAVAIGVSSVCWAGSMARNDRTGDLQNRIIRLAYLLDTDPHFYDHPENVKRSFHDVYSILQVPTGNGSSLLAQLGFISAYCRVHLTPGYVCGNRHWIAQVDDPNFDGYLFVTDWITQDNKRFLVLIIGHTSPQQTIIARVTANGSSILYDSFASHNTCQITPPDYSALDVTHYIKVISPTTFEIMMGSASPMSHTGARYATFDLKVAASVCSLKLLSQKLW